MPVVMVPDKTASLQLSNDKRCQSLSPYLPNPDLARRYVFFPHPPTTPRGLPCESNPRCPDDVRPSMSGSGVGLNNHRDRLLKRRREEACCHGLVQVAPALEGPSRQLATS